MIPVLLFPQFDPVIVQLGPFSIRWYALAYIASLIIGWRLARRLVALPPAVATALQVDDFLTWATLGVVLGGAGLATCCSTSPRRIWRTRRKSWRSGKAA